MIESPMLQKVLAERSHEMILSVLEARFGAVTVDVSSKLKAITDAHRLQHLAIVASRCGYLTSFEEAVAKERWLKPLNRDLSQENEAIVRSRRDEPTWEVAYLFPPQGHWTPSGYLGLATNHFVELVDGRLEVLPMPTDWHQAIVSCLWLMLHNNAQLQGLGRARVGALPVNTVRDKYREPDVLFMLKENEHRCFDDHWVGADLVMEIVSPGQQNRDRDLVEKRAEYAAAGIPEYWIVDRETGHVVVLTLRDGQYVEHGTFPRGPLATSVVLPNFSVSVDAVFSAQ